MSGSATRLRAVLLAALAAGAAADAAAGRYDDCVALAARDPARALDEATAWGPDGGGAPARHCQALALIGLGRFGDAAAVLDELAAASAEAPADHRALLYAQTGNAWLLADQADRAEAAFDGALALVPATPTILIDRARARAEQENYWEAVDDLGAALDIDPERTEAYVLRAAAYRRLGIAELARDDVKRALALDQDNPDAVIERALLALSAGDATAARSDFGRVLVTAPGSPAADIARAFLAELDRDR